MASASVTAFDKKLGQNVNRICYEKNITQTMLADGLGMSNGWINPKINGTIQFSAHDIFRVAKYLDVSVDSLMEGCDDGKNP